jgi:tetratricopeptide (TPR) repeat protein
LAKLSATNPEAYQLYLKGRYHANQTTAAGLKKSIEYFQQAIDKDPSYALAYAGLADSYSGLGGDWLCLSPSDSFPKAKAAAMKALELDDTLAEAHAALAYAVFFADWDWPSAEREFKRAIELNPTLLSSCFGKPLQHRALGDLQRYCCRIYYLSGVRHVAAHHLGKLDFHADAADL